MTTELVLQWAMTVCLLATAVGVLALVALVGGAI